MDLFNVDSNCDGSLNLRGGSDPVGDHLHVDRGLGLVVDHDLFADHDHVADVPSVGVVHHKDRQCGEQDLLAVPLLCELGVVSLVVMRSEPEHQPFQYVSGLELPFSVMSTWSFRDHDPKGFGFFLQDSFQASM